jgi:hypothetical protein
LNGAWINEDKSTIMKIMKTMIQTKYPTSNLQPQTFSRGASAVLGLGVGNSVADSRCSLLRALRSAWLVVFFLSCLSHSVFAADTPAGSPQLSMPPEQQARLDVLKTKGPEASLSILPVMLVGRPFDRVTDVLGVMLEQRGLQHIEIGKVPFTAGVKTEMPALSVSLAAFLKTNSIATDYALYAEFNGPTLDEVRAVVVNKSGEMVWSDHQTTRDKAFQALGTPRDPMTLMAFLVDRLSPQFSLNDDTAKKRSHKLEDAFQANSGYAPAGETEERMPARLKTMKESRQKATLMVLGVRMDRAVNITNASDLAKRIGEAKLFQAVAPAKQPVLLEAKLAGGDQMRYLWTIAREFQAYVKKNPPDADYVLYADYIFDRQHWQQGGVQFVVCDRQGEWVIAELTNSDQEDYQRVKPISAEGCDKLLVERLADRLR